MFPQLTESQQARVVGEILAFASEPQREEVGMKKQQIESLAAKA